MDEISTFESFHLGVNNVHDFEILMMVFVNSSTQGCIVSCRREWTRKNTRVSEGVLQIICKDIFRGRNLI